MSWRLQLRPWLWQLTRRSDNRIYQNQTVPQIVEKILRERHQINDETYRVLMREIDMVELVLRPED